MIKQISEIIPATKNYIGVLTPEHTVTYSYDTEKIKGRCLECFDKINGDLEQNYIRRGNYCYNCNNGIYYPQK